MSRKQEVAHLKKTKKKQFNLINSQKPWLPVRQQYFAQFFILHIDKNPP